MADISKYVERRKLTRVLALLQANIIARFTRIDNDNHNDLERLAAEINGKLITIALEYGEPPCKAGQVRNPLTGLCEDIDENPN